MHTGTVRRRAWLHFAALLTVVLILITSPLEAKDKITIGLIPEMNVFAQMDRFQLLAEHLDNKLGMDVQLTMLSLYGNIITRLKNKKVDAAFLGSFTGALAISQLGVEPLVRPVNLDGTSTYHGHIFVRKDSGIKDVMDMDGKTFAFVEKATTAGYIFPLAFLRRHGVEDYTSFFREFYFTGSHDASIEAVLRGEADIGAAKNTVWDGYLWSNPGTSKKLIILASSPPVPSNALCVLPGMSSELKTRLQGILLSLDTDPQGRDVLKKLRAIKFVKTGKNDYQPVIDMAKEANISLENYTYTNR